jgi:hypothetical protein
MERTAVMVQVGIAAKSTPYSTTRTKLLLLKYLSQVSLFTFRQFRIDMVLKFEERF